MSEICVCSDFIGVMSDQRKLLFKKQIITRINLRNSHYCRGGWKSYENLVILFEPPGKIFVKGPGSFFCGVNE